ncbi:hypothetical protein NM208_g2820 [Fusarium decemcellulare]|uniref:Uncharacterized protein n=1 Tax=Fusarium decemcellulare TaxID=57161 RepID=A0ACC1SRD8_9HYPO|nr:hypothetical protein NM208_g2820 [Fusarium decemcellulare]
MKIFEDDCYLERQGDSISIVFRNLNKRLAKQPGVLVSQATARDLALLSSLVNDAGEAQVPEPTPETSKADVLGKLSDRGRRYIDVFGVKECLEAVSGGFEGQRGTRETQVSDIIKTEKLDDALNHRLRAAFKTSAGRHLASG